MTDPISLETLLEESDVPQTDGKPVFEAPWQARAFGLVVATIREDADLAWEDFQRRLVEETDAGSDANQDVEATYYHHWLAAFERLLVSEEVLDDSIVDERTGSFAIGDRTAAEFVEGGHDH